MNADATYLDGIVRFSGRDDGRSYGDCRGWPVRVRVCMFGCNTLIVGIEPVCETSRDPMNRLAQTSMSCSSSSEAVLRVRDPAAGAELWDTFMFVLVASNVIADC